MDIFQKCAENTEVEEAKEKGLYPYFHALESKQDTEVIMEGKRRIMIGSNNYLGLTGDKRVIQAGIEAMKEYGSGVSGSRFLNGTLLVHLELEDELAKFLHKEASMSCISFFPRFKYSDSLISITASIITQLPFLSCEYVLLYF